MRRFRAAVVGSIAFSALSATAGAALAQPIAGTAMPLSFVENVGQFDARAAFVAEARGAVLFFTRDGVRAAIADPVAGDREGGIVRQLSLFLTLDGTSGPVEPEPSEPQPGLHHFLCGSDPSRWVTGARGFGELVYRGVSPGVDLHVRGRGGVLTLDLALAPGCEGALPSFRIDGAESLAVANDGSLVIETALGPLALTRPSTAATDAAGASRPIDSRWEVSGDRASVVVPERPAGSRILVDPDLVFATLLGGSGSGSSDLGAAIAVDAEGFSFVAGTTEAADFPVTAGVYDATPNGLRDSFVTKFSQDGSSLVFSTRLGGASYDDAASIALGPDGTIFVAGHTRSQNFPLTPGAVDSTSNPANLEAFVSRLSAAGDALLYSTFLGGDANDAVRAIAVDPSGYAYAVGESNAFDFPVTAGAYDPMNSGHVDAFVAKLSPTGQSLAYATYLGASGVIDFATGVALGTSGDAYVTGYASTGFPFTHESYDPIQEGNSDAFVVRLNDAGSGLIAGTFLGGPANESATALARGPDGSITICGVDAHLGFPVTPGAFDTQPASAYGEAFVARFDASLETLVWSTFLGGIDGDQASGIAVDAAGAAIVTGSLTNTSPGFPTTPGAFNTTLGHSFLTRVAPDGASLEYSTFVAYGYDARDVAIDSAGGAYVTGIGGSAPFPATPGAFDSTLDGPEAWLAKFDLCEGSIATHGSGCAGTGGFVPALGVKGCASPGFTVETALTQSLGHTSGLLLLGLGTGTLNVTPGCALGIAPLVTAFVIPLSIPTAPPGQGSVSFSAEVPPVVGPVTVHLQAVIADPQGFGGVSATNAVQLTLL